LHGSHGGLHSNLPSHHNLRSPNSPSHSHVLPYRWPSYGAPWYVHGWHRYYWPHYFYGNPVYIGPIYVYDRYGAAQFQAAAPGVLWPYDNGEAVYSDLGPQLSLDLITLDDLKAQRSAAIRSFEQGKKALMAALRQILDNVNAPAEAARARILIATFQDRYHFVRDESSVQASSDALEQLDRTLNELDQAWLTERDRVEHLAFLMQQQRLPVGSRDPYAHPMVLAANLKTKTDERDAAVRRQAELLGTIRRATAEMDMAAVSNRP
jgi:hypothetical protein